MYIFITGILGFAGLIAWKGCGRYAYRMYVTDRTKGLIAKMHYIESLMFKNPSETIKIFIAFLRSNDIEKELQKFSIEDCQFILSSNILSVASWRHKTNIEISILLKEFKFAVEEQMILGFKQSVNRAIEGRDMETILSEYGKYLYCLRSFHYLSTDETQEEWIAFERQLNVLGMSTSKNVLEVYFIYGLERFAWAGNNTYDTVWVKDFMLKKHHLLHLRP